jgi:hypothetical protein
MNNNTALLEALIVLRYTQPIEFERLATDIQTTIDLSACGEDESARLLLQQVHARWVAICETQDTPASQAETAPDVKGAPDPAASL